MSAVNELSFALMSAVNKFDERLFATGRSVKGRLSRRGGDWICKTSVIKLLYAGWLPHSRKCVWGGPYLTTGVGCRRPQSV